MEVTKFSDGKSAPTKMKGMKVDCAVVRRCARMMYWYRWGGHTFDIRVMRRVVGLPADNKEYDNWWRKTNHLTSQEALVCSLTEILDSAGSKKFSQLMDEHDTYLEGGRNDAFVNDTDSDPDVPF